MTGGRGVATWGVAAAGVVPGAGVTEALAATWVLPAAAA